MKTALSLLLASCIAQAAHAEDCQVGKLLPAAVDQSMHWNGPCKDGYADGTGVLEWTMNDGTTRRIEGKFAHGAVSGEAKLKAGDKYTYIGSLTDGVPDGEGYLHFASGLRYEGGIKMMRREGKGVQIYANGDTYQGEFRDGYPLDGDRVTYAGSGRTGLLDVAARNAALAAAKPENKFRQHQAAPDTGTLLARTEVTSSVPTNVGWDGLTPEQKDRARNRYPALEPGDEPPYPLKGSVEFFRVALAAAGKYNARGVLHMLVLIGADGQAKEVRKVGSFDDDVIRYVASAAMAQRYKPAVCHGQPCEMLYPVDIEFTQRL